MRPFTLKYLIFAKGTTHAGHTALRGGSQAKLDLELANVKSFRVIICVVRLAIARLLLHDTAVLDAKPTWRFRLEWQHRNHTSF